MAAVQNTHWIQNPFYAIQQKCPTDCKIHALLILGRGLQVAAAAGAVAALVFTATVGNMALLGLIPAIVAAILGTYIVENRVGCLESIGLGPPFVPGQPVGLRNSSGNCWLNSGLQLLTHVPAFERRMRQIPTLGPFLDAYRKARIECQKIAPIDTQSIRQELSNLTGGLIAQGWIQEDAAQTFEYLFEGANALYAFEQELDGVRSAIRREPFLQLNMPQGATFSQIFSNFFDSRTDLGRRQQLYFPRPPNDLLIQLKRFYRNPDGTIGKINAPIDATESFRLPRGFVRSGESAQYFCDAFITHQGTDLSTGHYVAYIKVGSTWWYCSDTTVAEVSAEYAQEAMKHSYILYYAKGPRFLG